MMGEDLRKLSVISRRHVSLPRSYSDEEGEISGERLRSRTTGGTPVLLGAGEAEGFVEPVVGGEDAFALGEGEALGFFLGAGEEEGEEGII